MKLTNPSADIFVPDNTPLPEALSRTTHLAIGAHSDDIEIFAFHGIAECFADSERWFTGITVTNGAGSPRTGTYAHYTDEEMRKVRLQEQRKAAQIGRYGCVVQLMHTSSTVKDPGAQDPVMDLTSLLKAAQPEVVYLHNPADKHDTHVATLLKSLEAIRSLPATVRPHTVYGCEVWRDLDWLDDSDKQVLHLDKHPDLTTRLLSVFDSQISGGKRYDLATAGRRLANATYHSSHETDSCKAMTYAFDLMPVLNNNTLSVQAYTQAAVNKFHLDVQSRLERLEDHL